MTNGPSEGEKAPDFCLPEASDNSLCLYDELRKGPILLAFYPTDFGITCTLEFKRFNEMIEDFRAVGVRIVGVSVNSTRSHRSWKEKMGMDIPLLSDGDASVAMRYKVMSPENSILKGYSGRAIFLLDPEGYIRFKWVAPDSHVQPDYDLVLDKVRELSRTIA
jgi:thioredoxin-dependent peroxiredoxin